MVTPETRYSSVTKRDCIIKRYLVVRLQLHNDPIGIKKSKERITINACANATGTIKLPLLFTGKYNNLRCFRGINKETLPMIYRHHKNAWVDATIFKDWFQNHSVTMVKEKLIELGGGGGGGVEPKELLIMDNCSAHPSEEELNTDDGSAKSHFLPPNFTSLIQPMDQDVLKCMKRIYRKSLLRDLIGQGDDNMITYLNGLHMLNVIEHISTAWNQISPETIRKSRNKLILVPDATNVDIMTLENMNEQLVNAFAALNITVSGDDIDSWLAEDGPGYEHLDVNGIVDMTNSEDPDDIDEEEEISEDDISQPCPFLIKKQWPCLKSV